MNTPYAASDPADQTIRIVGTGPVSLALRGLLARQGFTARELVCDAPAADLPPGLARRALALSLGSWQILSRFAVLPESAEILRVEVSLRAAGGSTHLTAAELGVPALGRVVRYDALYRALCKAAPMAVELAADSRFCPAVELPAGGPAGPAGASRPARASSATMYAPPPRSAVTVIADGAAGEASRLRDFDQAALLATVRAQRPAESVAFERFTAEGPLALLPLPEVDRWSLVWCAPPQVGRRRMELSAGALESELLETFGPWLGRLTLSDEPHLAPLQRRLRASVVHGTEVAIGNAAQSLHPVAGQGLNLGLRDAFVLAAHLGEARARGGSLASALPAFARARRADRFATVAMTDTLASIFTMPLLHPLQSLALGLLDITPPARRALTRAFMFGQRR